MPDLEAMPEEKTGKTIAELNQCYTDAEACDKAEFAEMRTNIRMVAGDHYNNANSKYWNSLRESKSIAPDRKIRLVKNHTGRIIRGYQNSILASNPNVTASAKQEKEVQHQKAAEQYNSVLEHIKHAHDLPRKKNLWCKDYTEVGEAAVKVFWNPDGGVQVGWAPAIDEFGFPKLNEFGQPEASKTPVMSGDLIFEVVHGFDLLRDPSVKSMDESPYLIIRKMEATKDLEKKFGSDPEKKRLIKESNEDTFRVYQSTTGAYKKTTGMTMVREHYYRVCAEYPQGYYYITTENGILAEGELPFGVFPIIYVGFDEITTSPRAKSIIKQLRPYQLEINRCASQIAQTQLTVGDDKIVSVSGGKPSSGSNQPGIRQITVASPLGAPQIIPGRSGEQFVDYMEKTIAEMYQIADVAELDQEINGQLDPYTLLFRSIRQKQKFSFYGEKFERFLVKVHETALRLFKKYASEHLMIPVLGKNEMVNMEEFKNSPDTMTQIKIEPMTDDLETKMGKQITLNHALQYLGSTLDKQDIGKFLRLSPYLNQEQMFGDMTQDYDNLMNDILALDRGQMPPVNKYDKHEYVVKGLVGRMKQPDFRFLHPYIQGLYEQKKTIHEEILAEQQREIQRAEAGFIPSGGGFAKVDFYVNDPKNPASQKRAVLPVESIQWLLKQLEIQGTTQESLLQIGNTQVLSDIARMLPSGPGVEQAPQPQGTF